VYETGRRGLAAGLHRGLSGGGDGRGIGRDKRRFSRTNTMDEQERRDLGRRARFPDMAPKRLPGGVYPTANPAAPLQCAPRGVTKNLKNENYKAERGVAQNLKK
jgi:hypothetical protein